MKKYIAVVISAVWMGLPQMALTCERCFGVKADTQMTRGIGMAMLALLLITATVLGGIVMFFIYIRRRTRLFESGEFIITKQGNVITHPGLLRDIKD